MDQKLLKLDLLRDIREVNVPIEIPKEIEQLADQRLQAKKDKDFALADELRNKITKL